MVRKYACLQAIVTSMLTLCVVIVNQCQNVTGKDVFDLSNDEYDVKKNP